MKIIVYINFILTLLLIGGFVWLFAYQKPETIVNQSNIDTCGEECKKQINEIFSSLPTIAPVVVEKTVNTIVNTPISQKTKMETTYIPIMGPITTTSTSWYDAPGTDFYLNIKDYNSNPYSTWEASLKIAHGNGSAYARIYDVTNKIAVNGSEVVVTNAENLTQVYSGSLNFWAGNNLYRIQLKSLNSYEVTFGGGRLKIIY